MQVARMRVSGIRGFHDERAVNLEFTRPDGTLAGWTVLAGRNGSGKSTLLQALALALAGPRATGFIPSLANWMSVGVSTAEIRTSLTLSSADFREQGILPGIADDVWMRFSRPSHSDDLFGTESLEPEFEGIGIDSLTGPDRVNSVRSGLRGWLYAGYGPFRHLGGGSLRRRSQVSKLALQVASLFDETVSLADAIDWLIEQHLYQLENRAGASNLIAIMLALLGDGLLPDGFNVRRVDSEGLWVSQNGSDFPLREMSDGYRAVTALVVDIVRQMSYSYPDLMLKYQGQTPTLPYPGVILIDEVDAHLHVSWQKEIGNWLKKHFPEIQFIVTTHSPYVCQSADPGGLILLPGPGELRPARVLDQEHYQRVVYGSGDDAILTELFGVETPYSAEAERLRSKVADLEAKMVAGTASPVEKEEYRQLSETLTSSLSARVDEVSARLRRDR